MCTHACVCVCVCVKKSFIGEWGMALVGVRHELGNLKDQLENLDKNFKIFGDIPKKTASGKYWGCILKEQS